MKIRELFLEDGILSVEKDDDAETVLVDKAKGTKTVIDKKNPNSPKISQDEKGAVTMTTEKPGTVAKKMPIAPGTKVTVKMK